MNEHALLRLRNRVMENGVPISEAERIARELELYARYSEKDTACLIYRFNNQRVSDLSSGDEVWAIIRAKEVKTIMLRRKSQPKTTSSLRVDAVFDFINNRKVA